MFIVSVAINSYAKSPLHLNEICQLKPLLPANTNHIAKNDDKSKLCYVGPKNLVEKLQ